MPRSAAHRIRAAAGAGRKFRPSRDSPSRRDRCARDVEVDLTRRSDVNYVTASISRASGRRAAVALFGLALALRLIHLGTQSLWVDEMLTLIVATPKPGYPLGQLLVHNIHGPLHTFVVAMLRLVSENDAWLRLPSALAGAGAVPLLYAWARRRFGHPTAVWAALLLAINPLHIHYSQEMRNYAFLVFFVLAGCVLLDRLLAQWSR